MSRHVGRSVHRLDVPGSPDQRGPPRLRVLRWDRSAGIGGPAWVAGTGYGARQDRFLERMEGRFRGAECVRGGLDDWVRTRPQSSQSAGLIAGGAAGWEHHGEGSSGNGPVTQGVDWTAQHGAEAYGADPGGGPADRGGSAAGGMGAS